MDTGNWIAIVTALVGVAAGYGASQAKIAGQGIRLAELSAALKESDAAREREINELRAEMRASAERQGERLGKLDAWRTAVLAVDAERVRRSTGAVPVAPIGDGGKEEA